MSYICHHSKTSVLDKRQPQDEEGNLPMIRQNEGYGEDPGIFTNKYRLSQSSPKG
ncbi:unnamed protein product [Brassica napus]|uniref:(rape) hypothetical protein n=1 Tax=Brassica napus TaxID=3708 RepID=A0A816KIH3_BRANA|nr:unnamed protein product [Brassica napus]